MPKRYIIQEDTRGDGDGVGPGFGCGFWTAVMIFVAVSVYSMIENDIHPIKFLSCFGR